VLLSQSLAQKLLRDSLLSGPAKLFLN